MSQVNSKSNMYKTLVLIMLAAAAAQQSCCIQLNVDIDHDLTQPTYGLEGKTTSAVHYDDRNGLNLKGTINDLLGPPIKMANGFQNIFKGHNLAGIGAGLKTGGAMLGFDAGVLEAAGAGNLIKGGLLMNGANVKSNLAGEFAGPKGQKIANIIELPVRVVAMKDIAAGNVLNGIGQMKQTGAQAATTKGQQLMSQGQNMKTQGLNQIVQGAQEGIKNVGSMIQKTSDNFNTAFKLLPIVWDMQQQQQQEEAIKGQQQLQQVQQEQQVQQVQQTPHQHHQHLVSTPHQMSPPTGGSLTGGSLFGGLSSFIPGMGTNVITDGAGSQPNPGYAALLNSTSPLTNLLMNPGANPFLFPLAQGPFGQAIAGLQPIGTPQAQYSASTKGGQNTETFDFNFFPGVKYHETVSSQLPKFGFGSFQNKMNGAGSGVKGQQTAQLQQQVAIKGQEPAVKGQQEVHQQQQVEQQTKTKN